MFFSVSRRFLLSLFIILSSITARAQQEFSRAEKKQYEEADIYFDFGDYHIALEKYQKLYETHPKNVTLAYKTGKCLFKLKAKELQAEPFFKSAKVSIPDAAYFLGRIYHLQGKFDAAIAEYNHYKTQSPREIPDTEIERFLLMSERAKEMILNPANVSISNMGDKINSPYQDYVPLISADESTLYFTSRRLGSTGNLKDPLNEYFEDIYVSRFENGAWQQAVNIGAPVNTNTHDATVSLSSNESTLMFYRTNENLTAGDLYVTEHKGDSWSEPYKLSSNINTESQEASACLSPDERTLIFSSNHKDGFGGKDLYRVVMLPNGKWSLPVNLGPTINTAYDEDAPFIHIDGKTLFFSSNGHTTMGGFDIFKTTYNATENIWESPKNMGYPINTVNDDIYFTLNASGNVGYYSTTKERGFGRQDIYKINLNDYESETFLITGFIKSSQNNKPVGSIISIIDNEFGDIQGAYSSNPANGKFILTLQPNKDYQMVVESDGFEPQYYNLQFSEEKGYFNVPKEILLQTK